MATQAANEVDGNVMFPINSLMFLMAELSQVYTQDVGLLQNCCSYHSSASKLLTHPSLSKSENTRAATHQDMEY